MCSSQQTCGAHARPRQEQCMMLPYCPQFCNLFPEPTPPATQRRGAEALRRHGRRGGGAISWSALRRPALPHLGRSQHAGGLTLAPLCMPLFPVVRMHTPRPRSDVHAWRTPRSLRLCHDHDCTPHQPSHARAKATVDTRAMLPSTALLAREYTPQSRLGTAGTPMGTRRLALGVAVDETPDAQAGLPAGDAWWQTQENA
jgi:hypothetical protein